MFVDLHLHSNASDGVHPPGMVVHMAAERRMSLIALTDHDSVDGVPEAMEAVQAIAAGGTGIALIPGVELSCEGALEVHLLGYGLDVGAPGWRTFLDGQQLERLERAGRIASRLMHRFAQTYIGRQRNRFRYC